MVVDEIRENMDRKEYKCFTVGQNKNGFWACIFDTNNYIRRDFTIQHSAALHTDNNGYFKSYSEVICAIDKYYEKSDQEL